LTLIVVSIVFIVLNVPSDIYFIGFANMIPDTDELVAQSMLFYAVIVLLSYTSNSINFLMYFASGQKFRLATSNVIRCRCSPKRRCPRESYLVRIKELHPRSSARTDSSLTISSSTTTTTNNNNTKT